MNKVILIGNLGKEPEIKNFQDGGKIASFSMATTKSWKDKDGNKQSRTDWHNVVVKQNGTAGVVEKYLKKGDKVCVEGELQTRSYETQGGEKKYVTEVVVTSLEMLGTKGDNTTAAAPSENTTNNASTGTGASGGGNTTPDPNFDDDLPF